jgi:hypothetical protein
MGVDSPHIIDLDLTSIDGILFLVREKVIIAWSYGVIVVVAIVKIKDEGLTDKTLYMSLNFDKFVMQEICRITTMIYNLTSCANVSQPINTHLSL